MVSKHCASIGMMPSPRLSALLLPRAQRSLRHTPLSLCGAAFETETDLATSAQGGWRLLTPDLLYPPPYPHLHAADGTLHPSGDTPESTVSHQAFLQGGLIALTHTILSAQAIPSHHSSPEGFGLASSTVKTSRRNAASGRSFIVAVGAELGTHYKRRRCAVSVQPLMALSGCPGTANIPRLCPSSASPVPRLTVQGLFSTATFHYSSDNLPSEKL